MALPNARYSSYDAPKDVQGTDPDGTEIPEGFRLIFEIKMGWAAIVSPRLRVSLSMDGICGGGPWRNGNFGGVRSIFEN